MKKFIPLLLALPLLAACGGNVKVVKPEFAEKGSEKSIAELVEGFEKVSSECALAKDDLLPSAIMERSSASLGTSEYKRDDKVIKSAKEGSKDTSKVQIDMDNVLMHSEGESSYTTEEKLSGRKIAEKTVTSGKYDYQEFKGAEKFYIISVDENAKTYDDLMEIPQDKTAKEMLDQTVKGFARDCITPFANKMYVLSHETEEGRKGYKFYQNEKVFTIEFEEKIENKEVKDLKEEVVTVTNSTKNEIWQIDLTDGKMFAKHYEHTVSEVKHMKEHKSYGDVWAKGDVSSYESESAEVATYEYSSSIKAKQADVSKFTPLFEAK